MRVRVSEDPGTSDRNGRSSTEKKSLVSDPWTDNKYIDELAASCVLSKVSKFETLSNSQRVYSPKVFPGETR